MQTLRGNIIGKRISEHLKETTLGDYYATGGQGDKKLVYRTDVINSVPPYPVFEGEKYVGLVYKYTLVDQKYKLFVMNEVLCDVEYQADGSSKTMWKQYLRIQMDLHFLGRYRCNIQNQQKINHRLYSLLFKQSDCWKQKIYKRIAKKRLLTVLCTPFGWSWTAYVRYKAKRV